MILRRTSWVVMTVLSVLVVVAASRYLQFDPSTYFEEQRAVYVKREAILGLHIVGGMLALLLGPWQFVSGVRTRWPHLHRLMGRGYVAGVGAGALGGLLLAPTAYGGIVSTLGFSILGLLWVGTTFLGGSGCAQRRLRRAPALDDPELLVVVCRSHPAPPARRVRRSGRCGARAGVVHHRLRGDCLALLAAEPRPGHVVDP